MNKTKRKIFETSMKLFAEKGYDATSVEEITAVVGIAKGTLYYHFSSKEEIFNFLIDEGMKLLQNSIEIKTSKTTNSTEKLKAVILIQIKILVKYEDLLTILLSQIWGKEPRNLKLKEYIFKYIETIEQIVIEGIKANEIHSTKDAKVLASGIFGLTCSSLIYKIKLGEEINIKELQREYEQLIFEKM